jgi:hypothetical protein
LTVKESGIYAVSDPVSQLLEPGPLVDQVFCGVIGPFIQAVIQEQGKFVGLDRSW